MTTEQYEMVSLSISEYTINKIRREVEKQLEYVVSERIREGKPMYDEFDLTVKVDGEILPVHVKYDAYDGTTVTYGDYFTPDYVDGSIEVKYEVEVYDEDGIEMCKFDDSFEFE